MSIKTAELTFTDGMHFEVATGSGRRFAFDDPPEGGLGPLETMLTTLAGCSAMDVISVALKKRQDIDRYSIHVRGDQREAYPRVFTRIDLVHEVVGATVSTEAIRRCIELSATKYCPVNAMLSAGPTEIHHGYRVLRPGQPVDEGVVLVTGPYDRADELTEPADELSGS